MLESKASNECVLRVKGHGKESTWKTFNFQECKLSWAEKDQLIDSLVRNELLNTDNFHISEILSYTTAKTDYLLIKADIFILKFGVFVT